MAGVLEQTLAVAGVVITLFAFSKLAGVLVILALIPPLVSARILRKVQIGMWEVRGKLFGRERYLLALLVRERLPPRTQAWAPVNGWRTWWMPHGARWWWSGTRCLRP